MKNDYCELCGVYEHLTRHHLIPQVKHKRNLKKKLQENERNIEQTINICSLCHSTIHANFSENELRDDFNTLEKLLASPIIEKYLDWRKNHLNFKSQSTKLSNKRR